MDVVEAHLMNVTSGARTEKKPTENTRHGNKKLLGAPGIATNGAIGRYERGSWPYY